MKMNEPGVLPESEAFFHTPSLTARSLFFTLLCTGRFVCDGRYRVSRASFDSFLLLYVRRGRGYLESGGQRCDLPAGSLALIDCYKPHGYGTSDGWEILWAHIDGPLARAQYDAISEGRRLVILPKNPMTAARGLERIYDMFAGHGRVSEPLLSKHITSVLTEFFTEGENQRAAGEHAVRIDDILAYINEHLAKPLTLEQLARRASLSPFYFSRVFHQETGYTLREYLAHARIGAARYYLSSTSLPLKEIASLCGYGSASTLCTAFRQITGDTPQAYRSDKR